MRTMLKLAFVGMMGLSGMGASALGQEEQRPAPPVSRAAQGPKASNPGPTVSIEFPGGTLGQFVRAMREAAGPGKLNIVLPKDAEEISVPPVSLKDTSAYTALQSVTAVVGDEWAGRVSVAKLGDADEQTPTFVVRASPRSSAGSPGPAGMTPRMTQVYSIRDLVEPPPGVEADPRAAVNVETVLSAIKALGEMDARTRVQPAEVMLHEESKLLIVRGTSEQLQSIQSVLGQLGGSIRQGRQQAEETARRDRAMKMEELEATTQAKMAADQLNALEVRVRELTDYVQRIQHNMTAGQAPPPELENYTAQLAAARTQLEQARMARQQAQQRVELVRTRAAAGGDVAAGVLPAAYDVKDLRAFGKDLLKLVRLITEGGKVDPSYEDNEQQSLSRITVQATPRQHEILVQALNTIRRAKANEPNLPGLNAEELIRKAGQDSK